MSLPHSVRQALWAQAESIVLARYEAAQSSLAGLSGPALLAGKRELREQYGWEEFRTHELGRWHTLVSIEYQPMFLAEVERRRKNYESLYHITFTADPKKGITLPVFKQRVYETLERKTFIRVDLAFEHESTNFHAHAFCLANHSLNKDNFASFAKKTGYVLVQHVKKDNGIRNYISKEAQVLYCRDVRQDNEWHTIDAKPPPPDADAPPAERL